MAALLKIARGLHQSYKNAVVLTIDEVLDALKKRTDCYEVTNDIFNRIYGDVDGKVLESCTEDEFNKIDNQTYDVLVKFLSGEYALMTSSSFLHKKISWRFVLKNLKTTKDKNKEFIKQIASSQDLIFPEGVKLDTGVYGKNQKIRMLGSNKDGENRPLRLVCGDPVDTLISYLPESCTEADIVIPQLKKKDKVKPSDEPSIIVEILEGLSDKRFDEYQDWIKIGMACYNEGVDVSVWDTASYRSLKYKSGECELKWRTFTKGTLTIGTLWEWLKEDNPAVWDKLKQNDYIYQKEKFEENHFKLIEPPVFVRISKDKRLCLLKKEELKHCYANFYCNGTVFIDKWISDPAIRTYDSLIYFPKQSVPDNVYNIFNDFKIDGVEGDCSAVLEVLDLVSGKDKAVAEYIEKWVAWIIQTPHKKTGTSIIIQGDQGIGKDTYFDFVGRIFGEYYYNTNRAEEDVFTRFNGHLKKTLFMKFEEASWLSNKKNESALKSLITCSKMSFEDKGITQLTLDSFLNIVMTTNAEVPVSIEQTDRRFVLIKGSADKRGDLEFWNRIYEQLEKPEVLSAYYYRLLNMDLTGFNPRNRPITEYYEEVKQSFIPYHAKWFQRYIEDENLQITWKARDLFTSMKASVGFELTETQFGRNMKLYPAEALMRKKSNINTYAINVPAIKSFLEKQKWWVEY